MFSRRTLTLATLAAATALPTHAQESVQIAFTGTLTGDFASYGVTGKQGFDLAIAAHNAKGGPQISVTVVDDKGNPSEGVLAANRFCADTKTAAVVGYTFSSVALAAMPVLDKCALSVIGTAVTSPQLSGVSPYFRRVALTDATQGKLMGEYVAKTLQHKKVYALYQQDDYGIGVQAAFKKAFTEAGGELVGEEAYMLGTKDFRTVLTKVKSRRPEAVFIGGFYTEAAAIVSQAKAMRINAQMLGNDGSLSPKLVELSNKAAEGMTLYGTFDPNASAQVSPQGAAFVQAFVTAYKQAPDSWAALGYDAGLAVAEAVGKAKAQGPVTRASVHAALGTLSGVKGATGAVAFDKAGDRNASVFFFTVRNGKFAMAQQP